jgi:hypothetical protein
MNTEFVEQPEVSLTDDLAQERVLDLNDMAEEPGGPLAPGWYKATVIEGYGTRSGKQFTTTDEPSKDGASRNTRLCLSIQPVKGDPRNLQTSQNYRPSDFTPERIAHVKQLRVDFGGVQGRWPDTDGQRSSLALAKVGQIGKATKRGVPLSASNQVVPSKYIGAELDVRIIIDQNNYNDIKEYAEAGSKTAPRRSS